PARDPQLGLAAIYLCLHDGVGLSRSPGGVPGGRLVRLILTTARGGMWTGNWGWSVCWWRPRPFTSAGRLGGRGTYPVRAVEVAAAVTNWCQPPRQKAHSALLFRPRSSRYESGKPAGGEKIV